MLHTKVSQIEEIIEGAIQTARQHQKPQLISIVDRIDNIDPFQFLHTGQIIDQHRSFWQSAEEEFTLVGIGTASKLYAKTRARFNEIQSMWNDLNDQAVLYDDFNVKGTGIVALGGFSFDPEQRNGVPWENFSDSQMTIPAYMLTIKDDQCFLTTNVFLYPEDHPQQIIRQIKEHQEILFSPKPLPYEPIVRSGMEEVLPEEWKKTVERATDDIKKGLLEKVVLARELRVKFQAPVQLAEVIKDLAETQNNSYIFAFESDGDYFVGATPERLAKLEQDQLVSTCLAGTIPRGKTKEEDAELGQELLEDPKNLQEHQFVVDMIRGAVEACCTNVDIPASPVLYPLRNLQHLYTPVTATLDEGYSLLDVIERLHPTPALGGLPQKASVDYIRENETMNRGWYAGPIGWFDSSNNGEFAVAIRSALIKNDSASLFAGCGVVEDSEPEAEYEETAVKLKPMLSVLGGS
ncbi:isochorismate synthase [Halobacillus yeomjeoni]|uniref:isochorismate synthase n=1 Tax=Halobacillus yeomjeoni TaxID=311194 RepID=UPI001CD3D487|nr:isochorismate synthase [Halobacillus yeomjeoni]MCA0984481.1 isochorismate synthase [Halobacillus yeomjeoni]